MIVIGKIWDQVSKLSSKHFLPFQNGTSFHLITFYSISKLVVIPYQVDVRSVGPLGVPGGGPSRFLGGPWGSSGVAFVRFCPLDCFFKRASDIEDLKSVAPRVPGLYARCFETIFFKKNGWLTIVLIWLQERQLVFL